MARIPPKLARSMRHLVLRRRINPVVPDELIPDSMRRPIDAADLMTAVRGALDSAEDQVVYGGVLFLHAAEPGELPTPDQARVHSAALPAMDHFKEPFARVARLAAGLVRKLAAPLTRRQERFNLDLLEAVRRLEHRLEAEATVCRELRHRVAVLEARAGRKRRES